MDNSGISLDLMRTFVRIVERGTLSAVARDLGIGQSSVTRHLRELEEALGAPLLSRTTRRMALTEEGSRFYARSTQILQLVERAAEEVRDRRGTASGTVRISCTQHWASCTSAASFSSFRTCILGSMWNSA